MKKSLPVSKRFLLLALASVALTSVYFIGYSLGSAAPQTRNYTIPLSDAQRFTQKYLTTNPYTHFGVVNALVVDVRQYNAMTELLQSAPGTTSFRIYYGVDDSDQHVGIVAGIGPAGRDNTNHLIATVMSNSGLCPPVCDSPSGTLGQ